MKKWKYVSTNYRQAWLAFRKTSEYARSSDILKAKGIRQPYRDNIMQSIFAAGWGNKKIELLK